MPRACRQASRETNSPCLYARRPCSTELRSIELASSAPIRRRRKYTCNASLPTGGGVRLLCLASLSSCDRILGGNDTDMLRVAISILTARGSCYAEDQSQF